MNKNLIIMGMVILGVIACGASALLYTLPIDIRESSPVQPIMFSHKVHAGANTIPCLYCHHYAQTSQLAGIPSVADCRACHLYISPDAAEIKKLFASWDRSEPIPWVRVNTLPDHVYFPHMMHIHAKIECSFCHGDVAGMDRVTSTAKLKMGWCLGCHRQHKAGIDCWTCHK